MGKSVTIGYKYYADWSMGFAKRANALKKIWYGGRLAWEGSQEENGYIYIDARELFGGDEKAGGLQGNCYVAFGRDGQVIPQEIKDYHADPSTCPNYKGFVSIHFVNCYVASLVNYVNEVELSLLWIPFDDFGDPLNEDMSVNPIAVIFDILTRNDNDKWIPKPFDKSDIDLDSFQSAFDRIKEKNDYVSANYDSDADASEILTDLYTITNTILVNDGQGKLKLVSYTTPTQEEIEASVILNKTNIKSGSLGDIKMTFGDISLGGEQVVYKRLDEDTKRSYVARKTSDQENQQQITTINKYLIDNVSTAANLATQDIVKQSSNNITANLIVSSAMAGLIPGVGEIVRLDLSAIYDNKLSGLNNYQQIITSRISERKYDLENEEISITLVEDVFTRSASSEINPDEIVIPDFNMGQKALPLQREQVINAPYFAFEVEALDTYENADGSQGFVMGIGSPDPQSQTYSIDMYNSQDQATYYFDGDGQVSYSAVLAAPITRQSTTVKLKDFSSNIDNDELVSDRYVCLISDREFVYIDIDPAVDDFEDPNYEFKIERGLFDTIPKAFGTNNTVIFVSRETFTNKNWVISDNTYAYDQIVTTKLLTRTNQELLKLADATAINNVIYGRHFLPLPLANVNVNGDYWEAERAIESGYSETDGTTLNFSPRNRLMERVFGASDFYIPDGDIPEENTFYQIEFSNGSQVITRTGEITTADPIDVTLTYEEEFNTFGDFSDILRITAKVYKTVDDFDYYSYESPVIAIITTGKPGDPVLVSFDLVSDKSSIEVGETANLSIENVLEVGAIVNPTFTIDDESIVSLSDMIVTGLSEGAARITANDGDVSSFVEITVNEVQPPRLVFNPSGNQSIYRSFSKSWNWSSGNFYFEASINGLNNSENLENGVTLFSFLTGTVDVLSVKYNQDGFYFYFGNSTKIKLNTNLQGSFVKVRFEYIQGTANYYENDILLQSLDLSGLNATITNWYILSAIDSGFMNSGYFKDIKIVMNDFEALLKLDDGFDSNPLIEDSSGNGNDFQVSGATEDNWVEV